MRLTREQTKARHAEIVEAVKTQPLKTLTAIAGDFGVSPQTVTKALEGTGITHKNRPAFLHNRAGKWAEKRIRPETWLHVGDKVMKINGSSRGRQAKVVRKIYNTDLTVSYLLETTSSFRKKYRTHVHETTIFDSYARIETRSIELPEDKVAAWIFAPSN